MANVKYQIFVSSTYEDLKTERDAVMRVILKMGHIPVGMEMFSAADEEQWKTIARRIDESDYYIIVIAHRYGSTTLDGISFTEKEYDYAVSQGVPVLRFVIENDANWPSNLVDKGKSAASLKRFKEKVKKKQVEHWKSAADLQGLVAVSLSSAIDTNPRLGWVRPGEAVGTEVTKEISRLSSENSDLREQLKKISRQLVVEKERELDSIFDVLQANDKDVGVRYRGSSEWEATKQISYLKIFYLLGSEMIDESNTEDMANLLGMYLRKHVAKEERPLSQTWPVARNTMNSIMADFAVYDLVKPSIRSRSKTDKRSFWTLTEKGRDLFGSIRRHIFEGAQENSGNADAAAKKQVSTKKGSSKKKSLRSAKQAKGATKKS